MIRRGNVHWVDLDPARRSEADKRRPAVIISNDGANRTAEKLGRGVVTIVPLTSNTARIYPFQVLLQPESTGLPSPSKAQAEQVRSVSIGRVNDLPVGRLPPASLTDLEAALRLHLDLT